MTVTGICKQEWKREERRSNNNNSSSISAAIWSSEVDRRAVGAEGDNIHDNRKEGGGEEEGGREGERAV
jgi:MOSC domain-containing protein YiiM